MVRSVLLSLLPFLALRVCAGPAPLQYPIESDSPVTIANAWSYSDCGLPTDLIQLKSIEVSPDPPTPGQNLTIKASGVVTETIEEGAYADVVVKLGVIKLLQKRFDICEEARNANVSITCPVQPGAYTVEQTVLLPKEIPRAKFTVNVNAYTVEDEDLLCLQLKVDFMLKPPFLKAW